MAMNVKPSPFSSFASCTVTARGRGHGHCQHTEASELCVNIRRRMWQSPLVQTTCNWQIAQLLRAPGLRVCAKRHCSGESGRAIETRPFATHVTCSSELDSETQQDQSAHPGSGRSC